MSSAFKVGNLPLSYQGGLERRSPGLHILVEGSNLVWVRIELSLSINLQNLVAYWRLLDDWCDAVSAKTGWPGVCIDELESLICRSNLVATCPDVWRYWVSAKTGWPAVSTLDEIEF